MSAVLCGDARYDSPGFSAKYMTYFIQVTYLKLYFSLISFCSQEASTKKIIAMEVGMKGQVSYMYEFKKQ